MTNGLESAQDPHLVVEVWRQRIWMCHGSFGDHDHVFSHIRQGLWVRNLGR